MNLSFLRHRLTQAIAAAEREREKAEREHLPATRDKEYGRMLGLQEALGLVMQEEAKD